MPGFGFGGPRAGRRRIAGLAGPVLRPLGLSATTVTAGTASTGAITNASGAGAIAATALPPGFAIDGPGRTWRYDGSGSAGPVSLTLVETLNGAAGSPRTSVIAVTVASAPASVKPVILAILAGQSNMEGRQGREAQDTDVAGAAQFVGEPGQPGYRTLSADITPLLHISTVADASNENRQPPLGPGEYLARQILADNPGADVVLVPCAKGSTTLVAAEQQWRADPTPGAGGYLFENMVAQANRAYSAVQAAYPGRPIRVALFWSQGEFDANAGISRAAYAAALTDLVARARARITGAASAPFVIGSMLPQTWTIGAVTYGAQAAAINAAQVDVSVSVAGVMYAMGPVIAYTGVENDNLHYGPAAKVRQYGLAMGTTLSDTAGPAVTSSAALGVSQGNRLGLALLADEPHATFAIGGGTDAGLFEISDRYLSPTLRWAGNGTGPAPGSYQVKLRARDGSGTVGPDRTTTVTVAASYGQGDQGPITATPRAVYRDAGTYFSDPLVVFPAVVLGAGLNLLYFRSGAGDGKVRAITAPGGLSGTQFVGGTTGNGANGTVFGLVASTAGPQDLSVRFGGAIGDMALFVVTLTGTRAAPLATDYTIGGYTNPPTQSASLAVPSGGLAVAIGYTPANETANSGTTVVARPGVKDLIAATRTAPGAFALGGDQGYRQLSSLVFEKSA